MLAKYENMTIWRQKLSPNLKEQIIFIIFSSTHYKITGITIYVPVYLPIGCHFVFCPFTCGGITIARMRLNRVGGGGG